MFIKKFTVILKSNITAYKKAHWIFTIHQSTKAETLDIGLLMSVLTHAKNVFC